MNLWRVVDANDVEMASMVNDTKPDMVFWPEWVQNGISTFGWRVVSVEVTSSPDWKQTATALVKALRATVSVLPAASSRVKKQAQDAIKMFDKAVEDDEAARRPGKEADGQLPHP